MYRSLILPLFAVLLLLAAGCASPDRIQSQLEFERLREQITAPEEDKILPDFATDSWTEEAYRLHPELLDTEVREG
jgi:hypothetical protein